MSASPSPVNQMQEVTYKTSELGGESFSEERDHSFESNGDHNEILTAKKRRKLEELVADDGSDCVDDREHSVVKNNSCADGTEKNCDSGDYLEKNNVDQSSDENDERNKRPEVVLTREQKGVLLRAKKFACQATIDSILEKRKELEKKSIESQTGIGKLLLRQCTLTFMSRLFVGCLPSDASEQSLLETFSVFGPLRSVWFSVDLRMSRTRGFAFLEYDIPEAASLALEQMDGSSLGGRTIKVSRPYELVQSDSFIRDMEEENEEYHRLYVANVQYTVTNADLHKAFSEFGSILNISLYPEVTSWKSRKMPRYAIVEYEKKKSLKKAYEDMNLFELKGKELRVGKCVVPPDMCSDIVSSDEERNIEKGDKSSNEVDEKGVANGKHDSDVD